MNNQQPIVVGVKQSGPISSYKYQNKVNKNRKIQKGQGLKEIFLKRN